MSSSPPRAKGTSGATVGYNALRQATVEGAKENLVGFSISGLATYVQIPELDLCLDMGECPLSALPLDHVFLSHAHGDHSRCLMRHYSLRRMTGIERPAAYYLEADLVERARDLVRAEARFEGTPLAKLAMPDFVGLEVGAEPVPLAWRKDLRIGAFRVHHSIPAIGCTVYDHKRKLKEEFAGLPGPKLAELRLEQGVEITREILEPRVSFCGDTTIKGLAANPQIWKSRIVIVESTFLEPGEEAMARHKRHTHVTELVALLKELGPELKSETVVLSHFSMKHTPAQILALVAQAVPEELRERVRVLI